MSVKEDRRSNRQFASQLLPRKKLPRGDYSGQKQDGAEKGSKSTAHALRAPYRKYSRFQIQLKRRRSKSKRRMGELKKKKVQQGGNDVGRTQQVRKHQTGRSGD